MLDVKTLARLMLSFGPMPNTKLQKIGYYIYSWYLAIYKEKLAPAHFEAWVHGPVSREIYNMYKGYGWDPVPQYRGFIAVDNTIIDFAGIIWDAYGALTADQLENMTRQELPWINARHGCKKYKSSDTELNDNDIIYYFSDKFKSNAGIRA